MAREDSASAFDRTGPIAGESLSTASGLIHLPGSHRDSDSVQSPAFTAQCEGRLRIVPFLTARAVTVAAPIRSRLHITCRYQPDATPICMAPTLAFGGTGIAHCTDGSHLLLVRVHVLSKARWRLASDPVIPVAEPCNSHRELRNPPDPVIQTEEKTGKAIRWVIVEDHRLAAEGLQVLLQGAHDMEVAGTVESKAELEEGLRAMKRASDASPGYRRPT